MTRLCLLGELTFRVPLQQQTEWQRYLRQSLEVVARVMELLPTHAFSTLVSHRVGGRSLTFSFRRQCEEEGFFVTGVTKASMPNRN